MVKTFSNWLKNKDVTWLERVAVFLSIISGIAAIISFFLIFSPSYNSPDFWWYLPLAVLFLSLEVMTWLMRKRGVLQPYLKTKWDYLWQYLIALWVGYIFGDNVVDFFNRGEYGIAILNAIIVATLIWRIIYTLQHQIASRASASH